MSVSLALFRNGEVNFYQKKQVRDFDLLYVLPEFDVVGMSRPEYNSAPPHVFGLPPTVKFLEVANVPLFEDGEPTAAHVLLREEFAKQCPSSWNNNDIDVHLGGYVKNGVCYTDHTDPLGWNQIVTCGNVLYPTGNKKFTAGELYYEVRQLKSDTLNNMRAQLAQYPLLKTWATISTRAYGGRGVIPFPHTGGNNVPALMYCRTGTNWIRATRVRMLGRDEAIPHPYYP